MPQQLTMTMMTLKTSMINCKKSYTKERHPCSGGRLECKDRRGCKQELEVECDQYCNTETNGRGFRLLEFASFNNLKVVNTFGPHKPFRRWTWLSPGGEYHNQIDYIMVKRRFQSSVNIAKTRSRYRKWPWACNHDFQTPPPKDEKPGQRKDQVQSWET